MSSGMWERGRDKMQSRVFHSSSAATFVGRRLRRLDKTNLDSREGSIRARECARMRAFAWSHARDPFAWWISLPSYPHKIISLGSDLCFERRICFFFLFSWRGGEDRIIFLSQTFKYYLLQTLTGDYYYYYYYYYYRRKLLSSKSLNPRRLSRRLS